MDNPVQGNQPQSTQIQSNLTQTQAPAPKSISWLKIVITVVIIVIVVGLIAGALWYFVLGNAESDSDGTVNITPTKQSTSSAKPATGSAEKDETKDWITSRTEGKGFTIKYPKDWTLETYKEDAPYQDFYPKNRSGNYPNLKVWPYKFGTLKEAKEYAEDTYADDKKFGDENIVERTITIDSKPANMFTNTFNTKVNDKGEEEAGRIQGAKVIFQDGTKVADIWFSYEADSRDKDLDQLFLAIISTFRFE